VNHGTRSSYDRGCRCDQCRAANAAHARQRRLDRKTGPGMIPPDAVREHLLALAAKGVGARSVADALDISMRTIHCIRHGKRKLVRAKLARKILDADESVRADGSYVDCKPTRELIHDLRERGWSETQLATWMGYKKRLKFLYRSRIRALTASRVERLYRMIDEGRKRRP
jgi:hypothetical protein